MIGRCYNINDISYKSYGAKGVTVDIRWRCYENFYNDIQFIPGYYDWKQNPSEYQLDKDIKQPNIPINKKIYSLSTCVFVSRLYNSIENTSRNLHPSSGYHGVIINKNSYSTKINRVNYGTYDSIIAAANKANQVFKNNNYPPYYINDVPYMSTEEVDSHAYVKIPNDKYHGVRKRASGNYSVQINRIYYGTYSNIIAAANKANQVFKNNNSIKYINDVPFMDDEEILKYLIKR